MKQTITGLLFLIILFQQAVAQRPDQLLDNWSSKSPIEKVYLHVDRENLIAGETAWFKAYLYSDYQPDTISTVLHVELTDAGGRLITSSIVPVLIGSASGHIDLPDSLTAGTYQLRSYTPTMINHGADFTGRQNIFVYGRKKPNVTVPEKTVKIEFFPEGGNLLSGVANFVAFKATNERGLPVNVEASLFNSKNESVLTFTSLHDGMGLFELTPVRGETYYAVAVQDALATKFMLPSSTSNTIALSIIPHPQGHFFEVKQDGSDPAFRAAYMVGQMQHHTVFRQEFKNAKNEIQGIINTKNLHSGILQVSFFNKDNQPLAERLCFVNNREYIQEGKLVTDTLNFKARSKNRFTIQLNDTVRGNFSVSVTDADYNLSEIRDENIFSSLLLTSDLRGYIHKPSYYFSSNDDSITTALDLLMMTNGWRRFRWEELPNKINTANRYKDPSFITLAGNLTLRDSKRPFDEKPALLMLVTADSTRSVQMIRTDKGGNFKIDSMLFFGKSRVMFADIRGKKSQYIDVHLSSDSSLGTFPLPPSVVPFRNDRLFLASQSKYEMDYDLIYKQNGLLLEGVTVKARKKKTPLEELEERYTTGAFSNDSRKVFDLVNSDESKYFSNVAEYLRAKGFSPNSRNMPSISAMGEFSTEIYLDEFLSDDEILESLPMSRVALIKIYSTFSGTWGNGPGGAIAIYTRKGEDLWNSVDARPASLTYNGYTITKEFYAPDYSVKQQKTEPDNRITLDWRPGIFVNNINPRIPFTFYNNDRTKSFKVVVEGMTFEGKMLMIEQTISAKGF